MDSWDPQVARNVPLDHPELDEERMQRRSPANGGQGGDMAGRRVSVGGMNNGIYQWIIGIYWLLRYLGYIYIYIYTYLYIYI